MANVEQIPPVNGQQQAAVNQQQRPVVVEEDDTPSMERLRKWVEADEDGFLHKGLAWISAKTNQPKWKVWWMSVAICALVQARSPSLAPVICNLISVATFSMKGTLTALALRQWDQVGNWLVYWIIFQAVSVLDFMSHNPLYYPAKTTFMAYFHLPPIFGARYVRRKWIDPFIYDGERDIVVVMNRAHPWLMKRIFELDNETMAGMDDQQLLDYVRLKRLNLWRWATGQTQIVPPPRKTSRESFGSSDSVIEAPKDPNQKTETGPQNPNEKQKADDDSIIGTSKNPEPQKDPK